MAKIVEEMSENAVEKSIEKSVAIFAT